MRIPVCLSKPRTIVLAACIAFAAAVQAQTWEYQTYYDNSTTLRGETRAAPGYITLDESGGKPIFQLHVGNVTPCFKGPIEAKVSRSEETTTITVKRDLAGCGSARFVLRNDGSGGRREIIRQGKWVWDGLEHGLTLKK